MSKWKRRVSVSLQVTLVAIAAVFFVCDGQKKIKEFISGPEELTTHYRQMVTFHSRMDGSVPDGAVIFIGDSITQGLCVSSVDSLSVNYGIGNDTTLGVLKRISRYNSIQRAKVVVLAIGINDFEFRSNIELISNYREVLSVIPRNIPVLISAVLPIAAEAEGGDRSIERIEDVNRELAQLASDDKNIYYCDAGEHLVDSSGYLIVDLHDGDGVHLSTKGYTIWIEVLKLAIAAATP